MPGYPGSFTRLGPVTRAAVAAGAAAYGLARPASASAVAILGDTTATAHHLSQLERRIAQGAPAAHAERARIAGSGVWDTSALAAHEKGTLGAEYAAFMAGHDFEATQRPPVRFVEGEAHAWALQRHREAHDVAHV